MLQSLFTTKEAATYLGVSASFLEKDRWRGARIPYIKISPRSIRYRQSDIDTYIEQQVRYSTSEGAA